MKLLPNTVKYKGSECVVGISHYDSHPERKAIVTNDFHTGEPVAALTRNLEYEFIGENEVAIDVNNCGYEAVHVLMGAGVIGPQIRMTHSGFCTYPIHRLLV